MRSNLKSLSALLLLCIGSNVVLAEAPPMPAMTNGSGNMAQNGMKHANVTLTGTEVDVHVATTPPTPVTMMSGHGRDYTPDKFDVLEGNYFNAQYGWLPEGLFNDLPAGASIWIERTGVTQPAGSSFRVFEAGNMTQGMMSWTMNEIYSADGARWQWDGLMQHDYYVADRPGAYAMSFDVYVGDSTGNRWAGFNSAPATLSFVAVPEPVLPIAAYLAMLIAGVRCRRWS